jgi:putative ABC transport system permease protein
MFTQLAAGYEFLKTINTPIVEGRDFSREFATDTVAYILNRAAVRKIGYKNPIGQPLTFWGTPGKVVGVTGDFHFQSLHDVVHPLIIRLQSKGYFGTMLVRIKPGQTRDAMTGLERLCKQLNPQFPFTYRFASAEYTKLYQSEELVGRLSVIFAVLAIAISCLGLLGLSIFTAVQRTKEIGIRKVLGAGLFSIFHLLSREFLILVGVAFAIASPLAWWAMHQWLQHFAYKTDISWWIFVLSGFLAILIAMGTVCWQAMRVAQANPIKSLRTE